MFLTVLWLPILVSAVAVFFASAIVWMATPLHKRDYDKPPEEEGFLRALREGSFPAGYYMIPWCTPEMMKDPAALERWKRGPWAQLIVQNGPPNFGRSLGLWFVNLLLLSTLIAYVAWLVVPRNIAAPEFIVIFKVVALLGFLAHGGSVLLDPIWKGMPWRHAVTRTADAVTYAAVTGAVFAWLWPR